MKPVLPFLAALIFLFSSCAKEEDVNNAPADLVVGGKLSASINGAIWVASDGYVQKPDPTHLVIFGSRDPKSDLLADVTLYVYDYNGPGKYPMKGDTSTFGIYSNNVTPYNADSGTVYIQYETDSTLRGSFNFNGTNRYGQTLIITNGQFLLPKQ